MYTFSSSALKRLGLLERVLPSAALLLSLCLSESPAFLLMAVGAVLLHEAGHLFFFLLLTREPPSLLPSSFGIRMYAARPLLPHEETLITLAGPLINLSVGFFACRAGGEFLFSLGAMHFLFAFFNLLPMGGADGERLLRLLFSRLLGKERGETGVTLFSAFFSSFFFFLSLYVFYLSGLGLSGVFFAVFSFPWQKVFTLDDLRENERKQEKKGENKS